MAGPALLIGVGCLIVIAAEDIGDGLGLDPFVVGLTFVALCAGFALVLLTLPGGRGCSVAGGACSSSPTTSQPGSRRS